MRAAIYARVSTADQAMEGTSIDTQLDSCRSYVSAKSWDLVDTFVDEGVSGAKDTRPGLDRLLTACRSGQVDVVVVSKLDRFSRSLRHLVNTVSELDRLGVSFASITESFDSSTSTGRMLRSMLGTFAEFERDRITERMVEGLRAIAARGYWPGGPAPYGYQIVDADDGTKHKTLAINTEEADVLRLVVDLMVNHGYTTYRAATYLNDHEIRTRQGKLWWHPNLRHQVRKPHLTGEWTYKQGGRPIKLEIPAILSPDEWDRLQAAIKGSPRPQRKQRLYPLSGRDRVHLHCQCGGNFTGMVRKEKNRAYYTCARAHDSWGKFRCPHLPRTIQAEPLEQDVWDKVVAVLTDPDTLTELAAGHITESTAGYDSATATRQRRKLEATIGRINKQRIRIVRDLADQDRLDILHSAIGEIDAELAGLNRQLEQLKAIQRANTEGHLEAENLRALADTARQRLQHPTPELMASVFDVLQIDLHRVNGNHFQGTATLPIPTKDSWLDILPAAGEVHTKVPRDLSPRPR